MLQVSNVFVRGLTGKLFTVAFLTLFFLQVRPWWRLAMLTLCLALFLRTIVAFVMLLVPPELEPCDGTLSLTESLRKR
jgi:hypothetical protein